MRTSDKMIQSPLYDIIADDFAHRYVPTYLGVNSRSGLTTLDPAFRPKRLDKYKSYGPAHLYQVTYFIIRLQARDFYEVTVDEGEARSNMKYLKRN